MTQKSIFTFPVQIWNGSLRLELGIIEHSLVVLETLIWFFNILLSSVLLLSHVWLFATPWNCSTPGLPVHHQLPESIQSHAHCVGDAIQPSHPPSSPSPPALNLSQHQGLFKWVSSLHQVAKVLEFQLQYQSLQWTPRTDLPWNGLVGSPCSPRDSQESCPTPQFKSINSSALSFLYIQLSHSYMTTGKTIALTRRTFVGKVMSLLFDMLFGWP